MSFQDDGKPKGLASQKRAEEGAKAQPEHLVREDWQHAAAVNRKARSRKRNGAQSAGLSGPSCPSHPGVRAAVLSPVSVFEGCSPQPVASLSLPPRWGSGWVRKARQLRKACHDCRGSRSNLHPPQRKVHAVSHLDSWDSGVNLSDLMGHVQIQCVNDPKAQMSYERTVWGLDLKSTN